MKIRDKTAPNLTLALAMRYVDPPSAQHEMMDATFGAMFCSHDTPDDLKQRKANRKENVRHYIRN